MLEKGIGLGYVEIASARVGTNLDIKVRNKFLAAQIIKPPFV
jgi:aminomethyltransferase